ncbi:META domain-containing protein [Streptomyces bambusae]|uniref:META domain-containing protein n=1 Tax=Streptomyces bambusae TaxID=1550616 RepID=UPI001CFF5D8A|nr:META domain-containing protein [Streptomyces bambusae]MCB5169670.1 META domain-containing protein [Streptomyces bambusae]
MRILRLAPAALVAALALTGCGSTGSDAAGAGSAPAEALTGVKWNVESIKAGGKETAAPPGVDLLVEGKAASGNYGCNRFQADVTLSGDKLTVKPGPTTTMACDAMEFETLYSETLDGELTVKTAGERLTLTNAKGDVITLTSKAVAPPKAAPLKGTKWTVDALAAGSSPMDSVNSVPGGASHFTIAEDGTVTGNLGCNTFRSTAKVSGDSVTFGALSATRKACKGAEGETEKAMTELLGSGPLKSKVDGNTLTLTAESGKSLGAKAGEK